MTAVGDFKREWGREMKKDEISNKMKDSCQKFFTKYSGIQFYETMKVSDIQTGASEEISMEDCVMISGNSGFPGYYIAKVIAFFDLHEKSLESRRCSVEWFYLPKEISKSKQQISVERKNEVIIDLRHAADVIDADSIFGVCHVTKLSPNQNFPDFSKSFLGQFFYNKGYNGKKIVVLDSPEHLELMSSRRTISKSVATSKPKKGRKAQKAKKATTTTAAKAPKAKRQTTTKATASAPVSVEDEDKKEEEKPLPRRRRPAAAQFDAETAAQFFLDDDDDDDVDDDKNDEKWQIKKEAANVAKPKKFRLLPTVVRLEKISATAHHSSPPPDGAVDTKNKCGALRKHDKQTNKVAAEEASVPTIKVIKRKKKAKAVPSRAAAKEETNLRKATAAAPSTTSSGRPRRSTARPVIYREDFIVDQQQPEKKTKKSTVVATRRKPTVKMTRDDVDDDNEGSEFEADENYEESSDGHDSEDDDSFLAPKTPSRKTPKKSSLPVKLQHKRARIPMRQFPLDPNKSPVEVARERLHVATIPGYLPCREDKFENIFMFVNSHVKSGTGGCMFISGVPGTGKTATVNEVVKTLREMSADGELADFNLIEINGMKLTHPHQTYVEILKQLNGTKTSAQNAADILTAHFQQRNKKPTLLVVDELDLLWTKKQDVLYHLFDWPANCYAKLIVIAIANTMDLPERIMNHRVSSRLGLSRTSFLPYNFQQLQEIVNSRTGKLGIFAAGAIELAARKVASVSGDARRCLDICRRSLDFVDDEKSAVVKIAQIQKALKEMFSSPIISFIRSCSAHEKLVLSAIVSLFQQSGLEEVLLSQVLAHHATISPHNHLAPISVSLLTQIVQKLQSSRIISVEDIGRNDFYARVRLNVSPDDVIFAVKSD